MEYINFDRSIGVLGFILGVVGIILTIKSFKRVRPLYFLSNSTVLRKSHQNSKKFKIAYNEILLDHAAVSNLVFWNAGNETLNFTNSSIKYPFQLKFSEHAKVLDAFVVYESQIYNSTSINYLPESNGVNISFDYFEPSEGFIIKVIHTETDFSLIQLEGAFKGSFPILKGESSNLDDNFIFTAVFFIGLSTYLAYHTYSINTQDIYLKVVLYVLCAAIVALFSVAYVSYKKSKSKAIPKQLKAYFDES